VSLLFLYYYYCCCYYYDYYYYYYYYYYYNSSYYSPMGLGDNSEKISSTGRPNSFSMVSIANWLSKEGT